MKSNLVKVKSLHSVFSVRFQYSEVMAMVSNFGHVTLYVDPIKKKHFLIEQ